MLAGIDWSYFGCLHVETSAIAATMVTISTAKRNKTQNMDLIELKETVQFFKCLKKLDLITYRRSSVEVSF